MTPFLQGLLAAWIGGLAFLCGFVALAACMRSSQISQRDRDEYQGSILIPSEAKERAHG